MAKRRRLLSCLSLSTLLCSVLVSSDEAAREPRPEISDPIRSWPQHRSDGISIWPSTEDTRDGPLLPRKTPIRSPLEARSQSAAPCAVTPAPIFDVYRRQVNDQAVTIVFLSSALASANGNATSMSRSLASSISQLQFSVSVLSSSASSAILSLQASASRAIQAVEASASDAVLAAEESASSRVSEALASASLAGVTATAIHPNVTTYQAQTLMTMRDTSVSVAVVAGAVVASVVGSTILSILGFYLFVLRRRAKREEREEQRRKEEEVDVNAALDRAIVSYIAKESPSPTTSDNQGIGKAVAIKNATETKPRSSFLALPPTYRARRSRPSITIPSPPPRSSLRVLGAATPPTGSLPLSPLRAVAYPMVASPPPGPPPTGPLPQLPIGIGIPRKSSRREQSRSGRYKSDASDILVRPPERTESIASPTHGELSTTQRPERRDSDWPLTGTKWV